MALKGGVHTFGKKDVTRRYKKMKTCGSACRTCANRISVKVEIYATLAIRQGEIPAPFNFTPYSARDTMIITKCTRQSLRVFLEFLGQPLDVLTFKTADASP